MLIMTELFQLKRRLSELLCAKSFHLYYLVQASVAVFQKTPFTLLSVDKLAPMLSYSSYTEHTRFKKTFAVWHTAQKLHRVV